ncbi:MAG: hypothetical protein JSV53_10490 [candidate division WOR-3 bacterium]|nr:MAG: hypothetical protein JSV53_10490 [candidate division WOR-3 bacterium]
MSRCSVLASLLVTSILYLSCARCGSDQKASAAGEEYPTDRSDTVSVELKDIKDAQVVIYYTEPVTVIVSYSHLIEDLQRFIDQYDVADDIRLLEKLHAMASETDSVIIADLAENAGLVERFQYRLADMLQSGDAIIHQKINGERVGSILVEHFVFMEHKTAGRGGRRFYLPDRILFLEVIDWMS